MRCIITIALAAACAAAISARSAEQDRARARQGPPMIGELLESLEKLKRAAVEIAGDQNKEKVEALFKRAVAEVHTARETLEKLDAERRRHLEAMRDALDKVRAELMETLTPEQQEKLRQAAGQLGVDLPAAGRGQGFAQRLEEAMERLQLTAEQREKVAKIRREMQEKMRGLRERFEGDRQGLAEAARELMQDLRQKLGEILTPEQQQQLRDMLQQR